MSDCVHAKDSEVLRNFIEQETKNSATTTRTPAERTNFNSPQETKEYLKLFQQVQEEHQVIHPTS